MRRRPPTRQSANPPQNGFAVANRGFTLIEIVIAVFIMMLLRRSLNGFNDLVHQAQERSVAEHRAYLIVWGDKNIALRPEAFAKGEEARPTANLALTRGVVLKLTLPAAVTRNPPGEWIFWPSGTCEPAVVQFNGRDGSWTANYSALTARPELTNYAAR